MAGTLKLGISIDLSQMRAAIRAASQALQGFAEAARRTGSQLGGALFGQAMSAARGFAGTMANVFGGVLRSVSVVSLALGGLGSGLSLAGATRTIADFDQAVASLGAISGATEEDMGRLSAEARRLGANTRYTAGEAAQAMIFAAQQGYNANEILASTGGFLNLAMAGGLGLADAALIGTSALAGFGLAADQAARVSDVMAQAANASGTNVQQLGEAFKFAAAPAASLGVSIEEATAVLGVMANSSIRAEMGGTSLRAMLLRLGSGIAPVRKALDSIGLTMADVSLDTNSFVGVLEKLDKATKGLSNAERVQVFNQMFGVQRATGALVAVRDVEKIKELQAMLENAAGTAELTAAKMANTLPGAFKNLQSSAEELALKMGDGGFKGAMVAATNALTDFLKGLGETGMVQAFGAAIGQMIGQARDFAASVTGLMGQIDWGKGFLDGLLELITPVANLMGVEIQIALVEAVNAMWEGLRGVARVFGEDIGAALKGAGFVLLQLLDQMARRVQGMLDAMGSIPGMREVANRGMDAISRDREGMLAWWESFDPAAALARFGQSQGELLNADGLRATRDVIRGAIELPGRAVESVVAPQVAPAERRDARPDATMAAAQAAEDANAEGAAGMLGRAMSGGNWMGTLGSTVNWLFGRSPGDRIGERQIELLEKIAKNTSGPQVVTVEGFFE